MKRSPFTRWIRGLQVPLLAVLTAMIVGSIVIWIVGPKFGGDWYGLRFVWDGYSGLLTGAFGSRAALIGTLVQATPYILAGLAVALAFRCGLFNIGVEGQLVLGALVAAAVGFSLKGFPAFIHLPLALLAGAAIGFVWGAIPGFLKARTGAHEVITTIMLNYLAAQTAGYLLTGPLKNRRGLQAATPAIEDTARLPMLVGDLHAGVLLALAVAVGVWYFLWKTTWGFEIRTVGASSAAAAYAGIGVSRNVVLAMALSGALAGLAGAVQTTGVEFKNTVGSNVGYGFDSIAIALLGKNNVSGIILAAILFGALRNGATLMQFRTQISADIISVIQALILLFVAADQIIRWLYRVRESSGIGDQATLSQGWGKG